MASSSGNDDDLTIPRAAINKMIKETLPNVRVANDARELVVNCCTEFIHLVSSEANEICNKSEKKTISPEHVINGEYVTYFSAVGPQQPIGRFRKTFIQSFCYKVIFVILLNSDWLMGILMRSIISRELHS